MRIKTFITSVFCFTAVSTTSADSLFVYFGTYTGGENSSKGIYCSMLDLGTGKLTNPKLVAETRNPSFLEIHPNGKYLYAVGEGGDAGSVNAYKIDRNTGFLKFLNQESSGGRGPCHLCIDFAGKNVLVANYTSGNVSVIPISWDGRLRKPAGFAQH